MMPKNKIRFGKLCLLFGLGLCGLVILELHQDIVGAIDLTVAPVYELTRVPGTHSFDAPTLDIFPAPVTESTLPSPNAQATPQSAAQPQGGGLAIDTDSRNINHEQQVAQINPNQIAVSEWQGASFPVENFQTYTSPFGYRASPTGGYTQEFHYGLDLAAPDGSYIRNWWAGKVVEVSDDSNCGTSVVVESGNWLHIYCHMHGHVESQNGQRYMIDREGGLQIWEGQDVPAGIRIGRVGMSGRTTGPHLHWGLKYSNNWVDPALVLRAMYDAQQRTAAQASAPTQ